MSRIQQLPLAVVNKIAAGEVIERPSSVAKELLENAVDAGGSRIDVEVEQGGAELVRVVDNGCGMMRDDAFLAFERHATSKLRAEADLNSLATLGFRSEALPSIAAVADVTCATRSSSVIWYSRASSPMTRARPPKLTATALGSPVEPEVNMT